jgi:hypothetical protein
MKLLIIVKKIDNSLDWLWGQVLYFAFSSCPLKKSVAQPRTGIVRDHLGYNSLSCVSGGKKLRDKGTLLTI